jgi:hypothetical protein
MPIGRLMPLEVFVHSSCTILIVMTIDSLIILAVLVEDIRLMQFWSYIVIIGRWPILIGRG